MVIKEYLQMNLPILWDTTIETSKLTAHRILDIIQTFYTHSEMFWIIIPIIGSLILMEIYFGRYKGEELGWNTAYGNTMVLFFVAMDLLRNLKVQEILLNIDYKNAFVIAIIALGTLLTLLNFFHLLPKNFAFSLSSKLPISILSIFAVVLIYSELPFDYITLLAVIAISIVLGIVLWIIRHLETGVFEDIGENNE